MKRLHHILTALVVLMLAFGGSALASHELGKGEANVNTASRDELVWFLGQSGISGATMVADHIVAYRDSNGPFDRITDLLKVKGIDKSVLDRISSRLKVTGPNDFDPEAVSPSPGSVIRDHDRGRSS